MSAKGERGNNGETLEEVPEPQTDTKLIEESPRSASPKTVSSPKTGPDTDPSTQAMPPSDTENDSRIKADAEESEKGSPRAPSAGSRAESAKLDDGTLSSDNKSRTSSSERASRPKSSDSRPKSSNSGEITLEAKPKRRRKKGAIAEGHKVTFTVTISVATPTVEEEEEEEPHIEDEDGPDFRDLLKKKKRVFEAPRPQNYYHLEYYLIPDQDELMKTDVVTYGMAAKVYMERNDPKALKTWQDGDITWIAWSHSHTLTVTKELLLRLYTHTLELRIWDTKDKVGTRAKFDRPKQFKLPTVKQGDDIDEVGGVKNIVIRQSTNFSDMQPKKGAEVRPLPKEITFQKSDPSMKKNRDSAREKPGSERGGERADSPTPHTLVAVPNRDANSTDGRSSYSRLGRLATHEEPPGTESRASKASSGRKSHTASQLSKTNDMDGSPSQKARKSAESAGSNKAVSVMARDGHTTRRRNRKAEAQALTAAEQIKKYGLCVVPIRMAVLFAGLDTVTNRLENPVPGIEDMFVTVSLDSPLLSEQQKMDLNPMIIKIHSVTNMPESPIPMEMLKQRCLPTHCKYSFFKQPCHTTLKRQQASNVYWDDINVILAGTFEQSEFRQYLNGPPLEIEVHDRDRRPEEVKLKATLFGDDLEDEKISNVSTVTSRRTLHNPFKDRAKIWDPYGVAKVDLSDLLLGHRYLFLKVPVHNCPLPDVLGSPEKTGGKLVGLAGAVDGPVDSPMTPGHYLQSNAMLKVKVELAKPLITPDRVAAKEPILSTTESPDSNEEWEDNTREKTGVYTAHKLCPFSRMVYIFEYKNTTVLNRIQSLVTKINARALELDDMPQHVIDAALSTYKLSAHQQESRTLDIVTGFQVLDGTMHLFVLEGLKDKAVKEIWEFLPKPEHTEMTVLFNSNMSFSERLYGPLDVDLCRVKLHEPLDQIVQQPLLYVRDMVPKPCFEALVRLHEMTKIKNVNAAIRNDLFPTADMVVSMSKEFGVPFTTEDFEELQPQEDKSVAEAEATTMTHEKSFLRESSHYWEPIDNLNISYMEKLLEREQQQSGKNFIKDNMEDIRNLSEINKKQRAMTKPLTVKADIDVAHNYSTQALNSTELAKEKLRQILAESPDTRYTYCQQYLHSMTVVPVNVEQLKKQEKAESEARWKTESGWIYPGMQSVLEANSHPKKPHPARQEELRQRWRENILHVGLLQAPLDRDHWPWEARAQDFELYKVPMPNFGHTDPITIHLSGQKLNEEKLTAQKAAEQEWKSKIVVNDTRQYFHRCLTETELSTKGRKSSNQISKLQGMLKDPPQKHALRKPGMSLRNIPPLNVVLNPSVDTDARLTGGITQPAVEGEGSEANKGFKPGPLEERSWVLEKNKIPVIDYQHQTYREKYGHDFNVYHKDRLSLWKRPIVPLRPEERDNHLFHIPEESKRFGVLPGLSHSPLERSATQPQLSQSADPGKTTRSEVTKLTIPATIATSLENPSLTTMTTQTGGLSSQVTKQNTLTAVN